ncbi:MAG TPA: O-antigen ligase family protein [Solirubrobacterales bacterium]|nr:O-antigen ligase family protein [Solirubrobacterales bacterium]
MSDVLAGIGLVAAAGASGAAILLPPGRLRAVLMVGAMALFPILIAGDQWHAAQIVDLRHDTARIVELLALAAAAIGVLTYLFRRWPILLPLAILFAIPFRVPLHAGGESANLLVPLYLVIAAGVVAAAIRDWGARPAGPVAAGDPPSPATAQGMVLPTTPPTGGAAWLPRVLAAVVVLYAVQALYSADFSKGLQNVCFFLVPFTVAFALLRDVRWDAQLLRWVLIVVAVEAAAFVFIGSVEYVAKSLFWNDQIIRSNEFHTYFRVNSVFWDPNVYGRYLALVTVVATAALLWARTRQAFWLLSGLILVLWLGLVPTFSQSSLLALLAGLAVLAAIKWSWRWTLGVVAVGAIGAVLVVLLVGGSGKVTSDRLNVDLSGRGSLISGGADLFSERPIQGYGSGSFQAAYRDHRKNKDAPVTISHTEPVTVAAEQGLLGFALYIALIVVALGTLGRGLWSARAAGPAAAGDPPPPATAQGVVPPTTSPTALAARAAVLAAFVALLVHTLAYAGFFEDPLTWVLLAVGASLAWADPAVREPA